MIALLTFNASHYVNVNSDKVMSLLMRLMGYMEFRRTFKGIYPENKEKILESLLKKRMAESTGSWANSFCHLIRMGSRNYEQRNLFGGMVQSALLNASVYMPLLHLFVPVTLNGQRLFSEIWMDLEGKNCGRDMGGLRMFVKFEIKDLGMFDIIADYKDKKMAMQIYYPEPLTGEEKEIRTSIMGILKANGLVTDQLILAARRHPFQLWEVFPEIMKGGSGVNVKV